MYRTLPCVTRLLWVCTKCTRRVLHYIVCITVSGMVLGGGRARFWFLVSIHTHTHTHIHSLQRAVVVRERESQLANTESPLAVSATHPNPATDRSGLSDHLDTHQQELDSLPDFLSNQLSFDPTILNQVGAA